MKKNRQYLMILLISMIILAFTAFTRQMGSESETLAFPGIPDNEESRRIQERIILSYKIEGEAGHQSKEAWSLVLSLSHHPFRRRTMNEVLCDSYHNYLRCSALPSVFQAEKVLNDQKEIKKRTRLWHLVL